MAKRNIIITTDYSKEEYIPLNNLTVDSEPFRGVTFTNPKTGVEEQHIVNVIIHPKNLLPGGKGAGRAEATGGEELPAKKKAKKTAKKK
jgi:hypothetical protein